MEYVIFEPWVGEFYYEKGYGDKKILILGESHYCKWECAGCGDTKAECCPDMTNKVINNYLNYKNGKGKFNSSMNTFTRFTNVFLGEKCNNENVNNFWNSIVFYNYVQRGLKEPRSSPTPEMFKQSEDAFFEILNEFTPDIIIAWGERLAKNMPDNGYSADKSILGDEQNGKLYYYKGKTKDILIYYIPHPSSSYFDKKYTKYLKEAMKIIKE